MGCYRSRQASFVVYKDGYIVMNLSILFARLSAAGKEVVLPLVARNTLYIKILL